MLGFGLFGRDARRRKLLRQAPPGPLRDFLSVPLVDSKTDIHSVSLLALDFETSGLNPLADHIVSAGYVVAEEGQIKLSSARHQLVSMSGDLTETSVVIHGITDDVAATGKPLAEVVAELLQVMAGKVMLAHHASGGLSGEISPLSREIFVSPIFALVMACLHSRCTTR